MKNKTNKEVIKENKGNEKLDNILEMLQNLFILEAVKSSMPVEKIRRILKIDKKRINIISKDVKVKN